MKNLSQQGSAASLHLAGEFLFATLSGQRRGFVLQAGSGKAVQALGTIPQSLLLFRSSAVMPTEPESSWVQIYNLEVWIPAALPCSFSPVTRDYCPAHTPIELISTVIQTFHCHDPFWKQNLKGSRILYWTGYFFHAGILFKNKDICQDATHWEICF